MINGIVGATRQPGGCETKEEEERPHANRESERTDSREAPGGSEREIVLSEHMAMDSFPHRGAPKVKRAVMKLMSDYTEFISAFTA
jgi:hypothetical protein